MLTDLFRVFGAADNKIDKPAIDMSSIATRTETHTMPLKTANGDGKYQKLVRTSSIDKIRQFNSYLCTQHYYVLPAILAWLRSSQDVLHQAAEKTILHFRAVIFNAIIYNIVHLDRKAICYKKVVDEIKNTTGRLLTAVTDSYRYHDVDTKFLKGLVYLTVLVLASQLSFCIFVICSTTVPAGLGFLLVCSLYISVLYSRATFHFLATKAKTKRASRQKVKTN